tara:strand:+ start:152 stop:379 length:228 start_codon:yes stop_codon:yes gene_type:complete
MYFTNNRTTMNYRTSVKDNEEQVKIVGGGYPETVIHKGSMKDFSRSTGIVMFDKRGKLRLTERQVRLLNQFLNNQ